MNGPSQRCQFGVDSGPWFKQMSESIFQTADNNWWTAQKVFVLCSQDSSSYGSKSSRVMPWFSCLAKGTEVEIRGPGKKNVTHQTPGLRLALYAISMQNRNEHELDFGVRELSWLVPGGSGQVSPAPWPLVSIYGEGMRTFALCTLVQPEGLPGKSQGGLPVKRRCYDCHTRSERRRKLSSGRLCFLSGTPWLLLLLTSHLTFSVSFEWWVKNEGGVWGLAETVLSPPKTRATMSLLSG